MITFLDGMKQLLCDELNNIDLELTAITIADGTDAEKKPIKVARVEFEVPKSAPHFKRARGCVRVDNCSVPQVTEDTLDSTDYTVSFTNLRVSFIDSGRNMVYFKADSYLAKEAM